MARTTKSTEDRRPDSVRRRAPANSTRAAALSRTDIVDAALTWIDAEGIDGFSMRQFAASLEISGPALYWHFRNRDDLLGAAADRFFEEVDVSLHPGEPWRDGVGRVLTSVWDCAVGHPGLLDVLHTQPLHLGSGQRLLQALLQILRDAGFPAETAVAHTRALLWMTFGLVRGAVATQRRVETTASTHTMRVEVDGAVIDPDVTPLVAECLPLLETLDIDALFHHTLDTMIAGLGAPPRRARRRD